MNSALRVTVVTPHYPETKGGVSDYVGRWSGEIAHRGCHVSVITRPQARPESLVDVLPLQRRWGLLAMPALVERIRRTNPDVVVVQYVPQMYGYRGLAIGISVAVVILRLLGFSVVTVGHELYYSRTSRVSLGAVGVVQRLATVLLAWGSTALVVTVPDRLARLQHLFPWWADKFHLIPVGSTLESTSVADPKAWRRTMGIPDAAVLLVCQALDPNRETLGILREVLCRVCASGIDVRLALVGPGAVSHENCINVGYVHSNVVTQILASADIAILPFDGGASGRRTTLINALAMGLPVITNSGSNTDVALFDRAVRLLDHRTTDAMSNAVLELVAKPETRADLARSARHLYASHFSWEASVQRWVALFSMVSKSGDSSGTR
jgi:glycosyltransferase involved in cell wall biosynthesis